MSVSEADALAVLDAAVEARRHLLRHRRRVRRRPQRADHRPLPGREPRTRRSRSPPRWAAASTRCPRTTRSPTSATGPTARGATSASTGSTWCSCTARRRVSTPRDEVFDALDTLVDEGAIAAYGVSVETCDEALTAIARRGTATRADHPQRVPAQAARRGAAGGRRGRGRDHRPRAAGLGPAERALHHGHRRSPPTTTAPTTGTARPSTSARPSPASTTRPGVEAAARVRRAGAPAPGRR